MKISARNVLPGIIRKVTKGAVNSEVNMILKGGEKIAAIVTNESVDKLGLIAGRNAYTILKASWVILGKELDPAKISARNVLKVTVVKVQDGAVNTEVEMKLSGGTELTAIITKESSHSLGLKEGDQVVAAFKASSVIVAVD